MVGKGDSESVLYCVVGIPDIECVCDTVTEIVVVGDSEEIAVVGMGEVVTVGEMVTLGRAVVASGEGEDIPVVTMGVVVIEMVIEGDPVAL